jgi:hypothetical protein
VCTFWPRSFSSCRVKSACANERFGIAGTVSAILFVNCEKARMGLQVNLLVKKDLLTVALRGHPKRSLELKKTLTQILETPFDFLRLSQLLFAELEHCAIMKSRCAKHVAQERLC